MAQNKHKIILKTLSELIVTDNWTEQTGPFLYLKIPGQDSIGPFRAHELKSYHEQTALPEETMIKDAKNTSDWQSLYQHPYFQRRKPSIVSDTALTNEDDHFYYLKNGKPYGPYTAHAIAELVHDKTLISTSMISTDEGQTWQKLYQVAQFDRRTYSASELPMSPEQDSSLKNAQTQPGPFQKLMQQTDMLINLAFVQSVKAISPQSTDSSEDKFKGENEKHEQKSSSLITVIFLIIALCFATYYLLNTKTKPKIIRSQTTTQKNNATTRTESSSKQKMKQATLRTKTKKVIAPTRSRKIERAPQAQLPTRKPKSFTSTPVYQERQMQDDALQEEDRYYDDGMDAIELDPIRKAVSKETFAPESEVEDSYVEDDIYLDDEEARAGESEIISAEDVWGDAKDTNSGGNEDAFENDEYYQ